MGHDADARAGAGCLARLGPVAVLLLLWAGALLLPPTETHATRAGGGAPDPAVADGATHWRPIWETLGPGEPYQIHDGGETGPVRERGRLVRTIHWPLLALELLILLGCVGVVQVLAAPSRGDRLRDA